MAGPFVMGSKGGCFLPTGNQPGAPRIEQAAGRPFPPSPCSAGTPERGRRKVDRAQAVLGHASGECRNRGSAGTISPAKAFIVIQPTKLQSKLQQGVDDELGAH